MEIKKILLLVISIYFFSCSEKNETIGFNSLESYLNSQSDKELDEVIACAASKENTVDTSFIFYYPIEGATNIQYFETENISVDKDDFASYNLMNLEKEPVFNGYLERFVRNEITESWCVVTYETTGKIHVSNPIRLKNSSKPTEWSSEVIINTMSPLMPEFIWQDGMVAENVIYFQVISSAMNDFISGTYTFEKKFQFYDLENVVLNITTIPNPMLKNNETYHFTMMGVSEDNWVNLVIQTPFITQ